ncbi:MAG: hypothetical protein H0X40_07435 [Chthoniobacterales bacterium]|nr:hypothetical protein [Chthoniobacterales bacterium]
MAWQSSVRAAETFQLSRDLRLNLAGDLRAQQWSRFEGFDSVAPGGNIALRYRFGLGRQAPWVLIEDSLSDAFRKEDERSGRDNKLRVRRDGG